jgi:ribosomal protein S18 acetylase RimI-like enzyme
MTGRFTIEPLKKSHNRSDFSCGNDRIDAFFRETVSQDLKRNYATCFVACDIETSRVAGFYTLSSNSVLLKDVPASLAQKLPRYPSVPAVLIGWLACHNDFKGMGLGESLLFDAIRTVATAPIGAHAIFAHAIDEKAATFYENYGFSRLFNQRLTLYLSIETAKKLMN